MDPQASTKSVAGILYASAVCQLQGPNGLRDAAATGFQRREVIDMFRARCALTVPLFRYAARARGHAAVQGRVVPQATDCLVPRFDLLLAGELSRFERHPLRDRQDASSAAL